MGRDKETINAYCTVLKNAFDSRILVQKLPAAHVRGEAKRYVDEIIECSKRICSDFGKKL